MLPFIYKLSFRLTKPSIEESFSLALFQVINEKGIIELEYHCIANSDELINGSNQWSSVHTNVTKRDN